MIDRFKVDLIYPGLKQKKSWTKVKMTYSKDGIVKNTTYKIPYDKDYDKNFLYVTRRSNSNLITISGNLRTWVFGDLNAYRDLCYGDFLKVLKRMELRTGIPLGVIYEANIKYIEIGGNVKLNREHENIIPALISYPNRNRINYGKETVKFPGKKFDVIVYDKLKERGRKIKKSLLDKVVKNNLSLRIELKIKSRSGAPEEIKDKIQSFYTIKDNWDELVDYWVQVLHNIDYIDTFSTLKNIEEKSLTTKELKEYLIFVAMNYLGVTSSIEIAKDKSKSEKLTYNKDELIRIYNQFVSKEKRMFLTHVSSCVNKKGKTMKSKVARI